MTSEISSFKPVLPLDRIIEVSAGLVFRGGLLLITQRRPGDHLGGLWEFPGGKRMPDESYEACLRRELGEELGIEVRVGDLLEEIVHAYAEKTVRLRFFACQLMEGEPTPIGCRAVAWIEREQLQDYPFPAADARLLDRLRSEPGFWHADG